jgi:hypothetical protein
MSDLRNYSLDELREIKELTDHIIANTIGGALDLDNLSDRVIKPISKANGLELKGWHAYRRALATNLHELGVPDIVIQAILRHEEHQNDSAQLHQDCAASRHCRHETAGV